MYVLFPGYSAARCGASLSSRSEDHQFQAFYNCGTVRVDEMNFDSGCKFINQGKAYIGKTDSNITIDNGCYLYAEEFVGTLNMGDTSSAEIEDFGP